MRAFFGSTLGLAPAASPINYTPTSFSILADSNGAGYGVSVLQKWPTFFAGDSGLTFVDGSWAGSCLQAGVNESEAGSGITRYTNYFRPQGVYIVAIGINDAGKGGNVTAYTAALNQVVAAALAYGYSARNIILVNLAWLNEATIKSLYSDYNANYTQAKHAAYNAAILSVATQYGVKHVDLYAKFLNRNDYLQADGLHWSANGHLAANDELRAAYRAD